jgi:large repetitive protein
VIGFSTSNFQPITEFLTGTVNPFGLAVSPNGSELYVASQGDNKAYIYSTDGSLIKSITLGTNPADVAFEPNGNLAYVTNLDSSTVSVIDVETSKVKGHTGYFAALTPDGKYLYVPMDQNDTEDGSVVVIKTGTRTVSTEFTVGIGPVAAAIAPNGEQGVCD